MNEHLLMRRDRGGVEVGTGDYIVILFTALLVYCTTRVRNRNKGKKNWQSTNMVQKWAKYKCGKPIVGCTVVHRHEETRNLSPGSVS